MTHSYQEKSLWLKNELECIRKLIEQNPRDPLTTNAEEAVEKTTESVPAAPSSSSVTLKDDDSTTRKRKSPETAYSHVDMIQHQHQQDKVSPHQKRTTSFDLEDVLTKLNLPINLDRLTKGQLLSEVEKRGGCGSLSMKSLKKELIDGLKERLLDEYKRSSEAAPSNACQTTRLASNVPTAVSVEDKPVVIEGSLSISAPTETQSSSTVAQSQPTPSKGVRKGSLMEEFRHLVNSSNLSGTGSSSIASNSSSGATNTTSSDDKEKVAAEFQARQNRHRDSMARKSQLQMEYLKSSSSSSSSSEITQYTAFSDPTTLATIATTAVSVDDEQGKASSQNESKSDDNTVSSSTSIGTANGGIWCDVSSPMKTGEEEDIVIVTDVTKEDKDKVVIVEVAVDKSTSGGKEQQVVVVETAVSSVKAAVAAIQQKAINEEPKGTSKAHIHTATNNSSNTAAKAPPHKTGGGSTTHNKTAATAKTVVSSQPHLSTHTTEAQSASHAAPVKKGLFSGMSMFGSKKTISPPATVVSTSTIASQSKATAIAAIVSPIADHQVSPINTTTTTTTSLTTYDDAATSASIPHANSEVQSVPVASSIAIAVFDVTAVTSSDAVVQKHLLTTTTTAPTANEGKKKDARLINAIAPSAAAAAVTATNTAPTTSTSSSSSLKLKDAFASKNLITSIVSNYNAALASPTPLLQQSASVPSISMHPVNATTTTTDSLASASSVTSSSLSDTVLSAATTQQQQVNDPLPSSNDEEEYIIEDR